MSTEDLLNVVDAANYLGIRPWTLRHWISDRKIDVFGLDRGEMRPQFGGQPPDVLHFRVGGGSRCWDGDD